MPRRREAKLLSKCTEPSRHPSLSQDQIPCIVPRERNLAFIFQEPSVFFLSVQVRFLLIKEFLVLEFKILYYLGKGLDLLINLMPQIQYFQETQSKNEPQSLLPPIFLLCEKKTKRTLSLPSEFLI